MRTNEEMWDNLCEAEKEIDSLCNKHNIELAVEDGRLFISTKTRLDNGGQVTVGKDLTFPPF